MRIISCGSAEEVAVVNVREIERIFLQSGDSLRAFFPTGQSPLRTYELLKESGLDFSRVEAIQIDEFCDHQRLFQTALRRQLIEPLAVGKFCFWKALEDDRGIIQHVENMMKRAIDLALLGLGPNGHVGFHEPGTGGKTFLGGHVDISEETKNRIAGATTRKVVTFGAGSFLKAKEIILTVTGENKRAIFKKFLETRETDLIPATLLKNHGGLIVTTDIKT